MRTRSPLILLAMVWVACAPKHDSEVIKTDQAAATAPAGFCRSTTCGLDPSFQPSGDLCEPDGWPQTCATNGKHDYPLWWRSGCIGYSMQKDGGRHVSFDDASHALNAAFLAWTSRACPGDGTGASRPSIDVRDLGPVACGELNYDRYGPNQNVIIFRDDGWPHHSPSDPPGSLSPTIALTTVTYDPETGEIYDVDMELNSGEHNIKIADQIDDPDTYDLQAVLTHETGHVFGLAHSPLKSAVMFSSDEGHDIRKRNISAEDVRGICAIYPPSGGRTVDTHVNPSGVVAETPCDPMPRHGYTAACQHDAPPGCNVARSPSGSRAWLGFLLAGALLMIRRRAVAERG
jgi:MYXO-CTERM domain-containing protein